MKVSGSYVVAAPRGRVWDALHDPAVLARTIPGCESLQVTGEDAYAATVTAGVASVRGTYQGQVQLTDQDAPSSYRLRASGAGAPGTIRADARIDLHEQADGTTRVAYDADAVVGGMIGGVGQRLVTGVADRTAGEFFAAIERELLGTAPVVGDAVSSGDAAAPGEVAPVGEVFAGRPAPTVRRPELLVAFGLGALAALVGVLVGRRMRP